MIAFRINRPWKDAWLLMRIPFSVYLMPVYWFALSNAGKAPIFESAAVFFLIHLFLYPASNGYNSYFDRDKGSIGGLETPPQPNKQLFWLVMLFDLIAVAGAFLLNPVFGTMMMAYTLVSKSYSSKAIRLKRYPFASTAAVVFFQGGFAYLMVLTGLGNEWNEIGHYNLLFAAVASVLLLGSYPLTQVYQHQEDQERGDRTISLLLGVRGTFVLSATAFLVGIAGLSAIYIWQERYVALGSVVLGMAPVGIYFLDWMMACWSRPSNASYKRAMSMNALSSFCLSAVFILQLVLDI